MVSIDDIWVLLCAFMVLEMQAGFLCLEAGLVRAKNALNVALKNLTDLCLVTLIFWAFGFAIMFGPSIGGMWGSAGYFFDGKLRALGDADHYAFFYFQLAFAGTAATIVSGAISERAQYKGYLLVTLLVAGLIYPVFGHWAWGTALLTDQTTWLTDLGFIDFAGSTVVHGIGGWVAFVYIIAIGPRLGRFGRNKRRFEPSNLAMAALGTILLLIGWAGFNGGSTLAFNGEVPSILANTILGAAAGGVGVLLVSIVRNKTPVISDQLSAVLAGLVAITASCNLVSAKQAVLIGAIGGLVMLFSKHMMARAKIDDAVDAVPVHLFAGMWGTIAVALFGDISAFASGDRWQQLTVQLAGIGAAGIWAAGSTAIGLWVISRFTELRVPAYWERQGLNLAEHGERSALYDLAREMESHRRDGRFEHRATIEPATEAGLVAKHYNLVLDRAYNELTEREHANLREKKAREAAEFARGELIVAQQQSEWAARHDELTELANRRFLEETFSQLKDVRAASETGAEPFAIVCVDLDRFKPINDTHGHAAGDAILKRVSLALRQNLRDTDFVARTGGDEFVLLMRSNVSDELVAEIAGRLLRTIREPLSFNEHRLAVGASLGYALSTDTVDDPDEILARADFALYEAKRNGRDRIAGFTPRLAKRAEIHRQLCEDMAEALDSELFEPHFQPQFDSNTLTLCGVEALARWHHPVRGVLTPAVFLEIADDLGVTAEIDQIILKKTVRALARWDEAGFNVPQVSVNVSARRLRSTRLMKDILETIEIPRHRLYFEVLETAFIESDDEDLLRTIKALKQLGIGIDVDDFGTGHASVSSILALEPHRLKLDRIFVRHVDEDQAARRLLHSMIEIANSMGIDVVAEGVETAAQIDILAAEGCRFLQGFGLARPMDRHAFEAWMHSGGRPLLAPAEPLRAVNG